MQLGIFAKTFVRPTVESLFGAVRALALDCVQFNYSCIGLPTLPEHIPPEVPAGIRRAAAGQGVTIAAVSGTFNLIHPDPVRRGCELQRFEALAASCLDLGAPLITLCTGTRDPADMWRHHPANQDPQAWRDLRVSLHQALAQAETYGLTLGVEPEPGNIIRSAALARRLIDEMQSARLKIIIDPANLAFSVADCALSEILDEAFALLGEEIVLAHAKELDQQGSPGGLAPGQGILDWSDYLQRLRRAGYEGAVIMHGFAESQAAEAARHLREQIDRMGPTGAGRPE